MKDIFARCFKKTAVQVCTVIICNCCLVMSCIHVSCYYSCIQRYCFIILIGVYFCRFKINHESHEFILESDTVANSTSIIIKLYVKTLNKVVSAQVGRHSSQSATCASLRQGPISHR
jgi:hypothetical protein